MKEYIASVRFEDEVFEMKREYRTKAAFKADLLENGFSVRFIISDFLNASISLWLPFSKTSGTFKPLYSRGFV